ncbi:radical SAM protein [Candidatus Pacearchaeota archaeon]|nr:radical SAM protein [Candidatus Pacearchaeota archaeon]
MTCLEERTDYIMIFSIPECNLSCSYCRLNNVKRNEPLSNNEIVELGEACYKAGIRRIRWTGGEPTARKGFANLVSGMKEIGIEEQYLSTNGTLLYRIASALSDAGIKRVNISLDTFDRGNFRQITGKDLLTEVLQSIRRSTEVFGLVKINSVLVGEDVESVYDFIDFVSGFDENRPVPRFIPLGACGGPGGPEDSRRVLEPEQILNEFSRRYGDLELCEDVENNNPFTRYYTIKPRGVVFGIAHYFFTDRKGSLRQPTTLRINPNGYVSNEFYSHDVPFLPDFDFQGKVDIIRQLIEDKKTHNREWHLKSMERPPKYDLDFWRFGRVSEI